MDDKVIDLQDSRPVCSDLVELLESILVDAKSGILVAGAIVVVHCDGDTGNAFAGGNTIHILGELTILGREVEDTANLRMHDGGKSY